MEQSISTINIRLPRTPGNTSRLFGYVRKKMMRTYSNPDNVCLFVFFIAASAIFRLSHSCHHYWWQDCKLRPVLNTYTCHTCDKGPPLIIYCRKGQQQSPPVGFESVTYKARQIFNAAVLTTAPYGRITQIQRWKFRKGYKILLNPDLKIKKLVKYCLLVWNG
jgi:hypothetical protein